MLGRRTAWNYGNAHSHGCHHAQVLQLVLIIAATSVFFIPLLAEKPVAFPMAYAYLAGAVGGQQNVFFKAVSTNIAQTTSGNAAGWHHWLAYVMLTGTVGCAVLQVPVPLPVSVELSASLPMPA